MIEVKTEKLENVIACEAMRGEVYRLLADCYRLPESGFEENLETLRQHLGVWESDAGEAADAMIAAFTEIKPDALAVEFARLFVGPYGLPAPPYGSVYLEQDRRLMGNTTLLARQMYRETGFDTAADFMDAPDHISVELEFLYLLIFSEVQALIRQDIEAAAAGIRQQRLFLENHIGRWVDPFAQAVTVNTENGFYKCLVEVTRQFITEDREKFAGTSLPEPADTYKSEVEEIHPTFEGSGYRERGAEP